MQKNHLNSQNCVLAIYNQNCFFNTLHSIDNIAFNKPPKFTNILFWQSFDGFWLILSKHTTIGWMKKDQMDKCCRCLKNEINKILVN
jgi:hypothetical protein